MGVQGEESVVEGVQAAVAPGTSPDTAMSPAGLGVRGEDIEQVSPPGASYVLVKRALDLSIALVVFVLTLPLMLVIGVLVRHDSPGPILFAQPRVGRGGRVFTFYKFRTMRVDARTRFPELYSYRYTPEEFDQIFLKLPDDPRLTRFGRTLRKTSLDELPNLVNVIRGEMSLVGPRPEIPDMLGYYGPHETVKFLVKPGVTGLWQVSGRAKLRYREMIAKDVEYVRRRSLRYDLELLVKTVKVVVTREGAI